MMRGWLTALVIFLMPASAIAGAWPREPGAVFLSFGHTASGNPATIGSTAFQLDGYTTLNLEYGLSKRLTFGLDAGRGKSGTYSAVAFARMPVQFGDGPNLFAVQAGIGATGTATTSQTMLQIGASWGRGLQTQFGNGWVSLDSIVRYRLSTQDLIAKADLTVGLKPDERHMIMLQIQAGKYPGNDPYVRLAPSVARQIGPGKHIELGFQFGLVGTTDMGLKLGTWLEF